MSADSNPAWMLRENARLFPDKLAIASPLGELSYRAFEERSDAFARILFDAGLRQGTKTILMVKPSIDLYVMAFALLKVGAIPIVVDPGMGIKRLLYSYKSVAAEAFVGIPIAHAIRMLTPQFFPNLKVKAWLKNGKLTTGVAPSGATGAFPIAPTRKDDLGIITFTTGSTGPAKPVEATYGMVSAIVEIIKKAFNIVPADLDLVTAPFFGIVSLAIGATVVIPEMNPGKPAEVDPQTIIDTINKYKITCMFASPALLAKVGAYALQNKIVMPSLNCVNSGGAPITLHIMKTFKAAMRPEGKLYTGWGATEGLPLAAIEEAEIFRELTPPINQGRGTPIGYAVPGVQVRFIRMTKDPLPIWSDSLQVESGTIGEIVVQGPNVSRAYHQSPASDAAHKIRDNDGGIWHRTGDLGWIDSRGRIFFCGRMAHSFLNETGELMHSVSCEGVSNAHPKVKRSALVPVGKRPVMCIETYEKTSDAERDQIHKEVLALLAACPVTRSVNTVLFHRHFPVDLRHNAKIERPKLAFWAKQQLQGKSLGIEAFKLIPILGWLYIFLLPLLPLEAWYWWAIWWIDLFLSLPVHIAQIPKGIEAGQIHGYSKKEAAFRTILLGATWWKPLLPS